MPCVLSLSQSCVAAFLDVVIDGRAVETPPMSAVNLLEGLSRTVVYMTYSQLTALVKPAAPARGQCQPASASLGPCVPTSAGVLCRSYLTDCPSLGWLHAERDVERSAQGGSDGFGKLAGKFTPEQAREKQQP